MGEEGSETEVSKPGVEPEKEDLIEAYIQYSEESRYRDGLMHNSYYFILIAIVLVSGQLINTGPLHHLFPTVRLGLTLILLGMATIGIGVVMKTYQRKRNMAERERKLLENVLDDYFTSSGIYEQSFSGIDRTRDNPFAIDRNVITYAQGPIEKVFIHRLPISQIALAIIVGGIGVSLFGGITLLFIFIA